jgi:hypothetical protein
LCALFPFDHGSVRKQARLLNEKADPNAECVVREGARKAGPAAGGGAGGLEPIAAELAARGDQVEPGKPAKLLRAAAKTLKTLASCDPSNIHPSNTPDRAPGKRQKSAIPALGRGSGAELEQLRLVDVAGGRDRAQAATADPKSFAARPPQTTPIPALARRRRISALYFIRPGSAEAVRREP